MQIRHGTLDNQLHVMVLSLPHLHSVELGLVVRAGPRFENRKTTGLSHFVEHMLFRGTRGVAGRFSLHAEVEGLGSPIGAATGRDYSHFSIVVPPRNLTRAAELFSLIMLHPTFEEIELERQIILEELLGDLDEEGRDVNAENHSRVMLWPGSPLGMNILGTAKTITGFDKDDLHAHFARHYVARNATVYVAGAVSFDDAMALVSKYFKQMAPGNQLEAPIVQETVMGPKVLFLHDDDSQDGLLLSFITPSFRALEHPAMQLLQSVLSDGISSRLQWRLCEQLGMVYDLDAGMDSYFDTGSYDIEISAAPGKITSLTREVLSVLAEVRSGPIQAQELERAKERHRISMEMALDNPTALAAWIATSGLYQDPPTVEESLARVAALSLADLQQVACEVFRPENLAMVVTGRRRERQEVLRMIHERWEA